MKFNKIVCFYIGDVFAGKHIIVKILFLFILSQGFALAHVVPFHLVDVISGD